MDELNLTLFGGIEIQCDGENIDISSRKALALLAYLAVTARSQSRDHLATLLWPESDEQRARANLRGALWALNQTPAGAWVKASAEDVALRNEALEVDVRRFEAHLNGAVEVADLQEAQHLYRDDFLHGFSLSDSSAFETWAAARREYYRREALSALQQLANKRLEEKDYAEAEVLARRQIAIDNLDERAYRQLFLALAHKGQRAVALKEYEALQALLDEELGVAPSQATKAVIEQVRSGEVVAGGVAEALAAEATSDGDRGTADPMAVAPPSPYRGLFAFREADAPFFFGREAFIERLLKAVRSRSLVAVVGSSGSGKSSVVFAGLVPTLRRQKGWLIASLRPGSRPFLALAGALVDLLDRQLSETERLLEARKLSEALRGGDITLQEVLERAVEKYQRSEGGRGQVLLVIDQFEELYSHVADGESRRHFLNMLLDLNVEQQFRRHPLCIIVTTLRADFMGRVLGYRPLADALYEADAKLGPMTRAELERAIVRPAQLQGASLAPGLVARILDDVGDEPGNLPLLAFALDALWPLQKNGQLTHGAYEAIGKVDGALVRYADGVMAELAPEKKARARRIFMQLVQPGEGTGALRRLATREEIGEEDWPLVQWLADKRLLVTGRDVVGTESVELAHETLIESWGQLRGWLEEDRAFRTWQEQVRAALRGWRAHEEDEGALLRGLALATAIEWMQRRAGDLSDAEGNFIERSRAVRQRRRAREEQARAERERLRQTRLLVLGAGLVAALFLAILAGTQWWRAEQQRQALADAQAALVEERDLAVQALSEQLAAEAREQRSSDLSLAHLLALEAVRRSDSQAAQESLGVVLAHNPRLRAQLLMSDDVLHSIALAPNGELLAMAGEQAEITLWRVQHLPFTTQQLATLTTPSDKSVRELVFSPDGSLLAAVQIDAVSIFDVTRPSQASQDVPLAIEEGGGGIAIDAAAFSPDGDRLATGAGDTLKLWDLNEEQEIAFLTVESLDASALDFTPDGEQIVAAGENGDLLVWEPESGEKRQVDVGIQLFSVAVNGEGTQVAVAGQPSVLQVWQLDPLQLVAAAEEVPANILFDVTYLADGRLVAAGNDGQLAIWDVDGPQLRPEPLAGHSDTVQAIAADRSGRWLAAVDLSGRATLWNVDRQPATGFPLQGHRGSVHDLVFGDGQWLSSLSCEQWTLFVLRPDEPWACTWMEAGIWRLGGKVADQILREQLVQIENNDKRIGALALAPDGRMALAGFEDGSIARWDYGELSEIEILALRRRDPIVSFAFDGSGNMLAVGSCSDSTASEPSPSYSSCSAGNIRLWEAGSLQQAPQKELALNGKPAWSALSVDGRWLAGGFPDDTLLERLLLWDLRQDEELPSQRLNFSRTSLTALAFSPDGEQLAVGNHDGVVTFWDLLGAQKENAIETSSGAILDLAYSPDGRYLAIGGCAVGTGYLLVALSLVNCAAPKLTVLDLETGRPLRNPFVGHQRAILSLAFNGDGSLLASGDFGGEIILWDLGSTAEALACRRAGRNMTPEEWERYFGDEPYRPTCPQETLERPDNGQEDDQQGPDD